MKKIIMALLFLLFMASAFAASSANYRIDAEYQENAGIDESGSNGYMTSANYKMTGVIENVGTEATGNSANYILRTGYWGYHDTITLQVPGGIGGGGGGLMTLPENEKKTPFDMNVVSLGVPTEYLQYSILFIILIVFSIIIFPYPQAFYLANKARKGLK